LALTLSWTLLNKLPSMVDTCGLLLGRGVWSMSDLLTCVNCAYEIDQASKIGLCDNCQRAYEMGERESERVLCGDCLRSDCKGCE